MMFSQRGNSKNNHYLLILNALFMILAVERTDSTTILMMHTNGKVTLVSGQPVTLQCRMIGNDNAKFKWYRRNVGGLLDLVLKPDDDSYEIHRDRLVIRKQTKKETGDYVCRAYREDEALGIDPREFAIVKVRFPTYIDDFGVKTSHTGESSTATVGERLELLCRALDYGGSINITWWRSTKPDNDQEMVQILEPVNYGSTEPSSSTNSEYNSDKNVSIEVIDRYNRKLVIEPVRRDHRGHYACIVDNGVTEPTRKVIFIRVKDKFAPLWPLIGIAVESFILFIIIRKWGIGRASSKDVLTSFSGLASKPPDTAEGILVCTQCSKHLFYYVPIPGMTRGFNSKQVRSHECL